MAIACTSLLRPRPWQLVRHPPFIFPPYILFVPLPNPSITHSTIILRISPLANSTFLIFLQAQTRNQHVQTCIDTYKYTGKERDPDLSGGWPPLHCRCVRNHHPHLQFSLATRPTTPKQCNNLPTTISTWTFYHVIDQLTDIFIYYLKYQWHKKIFQHYIVDDYLYKYYSFIF